MNSCKIPEKLQRPEFRFILIKKGTTEDLTISSGSANIFSGGVGVSSITLSGGSVGERIMLVSNGTFWFTM